MTTINGVDPRGAGDRLRVNQAAKEANCSGGMIYFWIAENRFKSWTVTRRGFERGIRYIDAKVFAIF